MTSRMIRMLRPMLLLTGIALSACSNAPPAPLAVVTAPHLPPPERPILNPPEPVSLHALDWKVVQDAVTKQMYMGLTANDFATLEQDQLVLAAFIGAAMDTIRFYAQDNAAANNAAASADHAVNK